jgi:DNA invertase Pin-like site-specific DNA recombinase
MEVQMQLQSTPSPAPPALPGAPAVALYCRVSTDEQADRQTIDAQRDFLRRYCDLHELPIADAYVDDGWPGTLALAERPEGHRLLADAAAHRFYVVLTYRLDRLGRSLRVLLDAHTALDAHGVTIRSATEPLTRRRRSAGSCSNCSAAWPNWRRARSASA